MKNNRIGKLPSDPCLNEFFKFFSKKKYGPKSIVKKYVSHHRSEKKGGIKKNILVGFMRLFRINTLTHRHESEKKKFLFYWKKKKDVLNFIFQTL